MEAYAGQSYRNRYLNYLFKLFYSFLQLVINTLGSVNMVNISRLSNSSQSITRLTTSTTNESQLVVWPVECLESTGFKAQASEGINSKAFQDLPLRAEKQVRPAPAIATAKFRHRP